jgi:hypothetical protein
MSLMKLPGFSADLTVYDTKSRERWQHTKTINIEPARMALDPGKEYNTPGGGFGYYSGGGSGRSVPEVLLDWVTGGGFRCQPGETGWAETKCILGTMWCNDKCGSWRGDPNPRQSGWHACGVCTPKFSW